MEPRVFTLQDGAVVEATPEHFRSWYTHRTNVVVRETVVGGGCAHTLFLGANWGDDSDPVFFVTHVSGGPRDGYSLRAGNLQTALENHNVAVMAMKG